MTGSRVLVVGATGPLRPAALLLAARGEDVTALARPGRRLDDLVAAQPGVGALAVDLSDAGALDGALDGRAWDQVLLYAPTAPDDAVAALRAAGRERVVELLTSAAAEPDEGGADGGADSGAVTAADLPPAPDGRTVRLLLGWAREGGGTRWHSPAEISSAALAVLASGEDRVLGSLRPWEDKPA